MDYCSYLFVPADSPRKIERADAGGAHALILDLEDSVARDRKADARTIAARHLAEVLGARKRAYFVRVNSLATGLAESDVAATVSGRPEGYMLPKCEGREDIETLSRIIERCGGGAEIGIIAIATETVRAVRSLMRSDWRHPRLRALTWGGEDLASDMGALRNRAADGGYLGPFRLARDLTLLAALEAGVDAIDAVYTDFRDTEGLATESRLASELGFSGKMAIHPLQIAPIHAAFVPDPSQVRWAQEVLASLAEAESGVASLHGQMLDTPHELRARRVLARARLNAGDGSN